MEKILDVRDGCLGAKTRKKPQLTPEQLELVIKEQVQKIISDLLTQTKGE